MTTTSKPNPFEGCWQTQWSDCGTGKNYVGSARLALKPDAANPKQLTGAWTGTADDATGFRHCGFLIGTQTGAVLKGTWYEVLYKNNLTCPVLSYVGTFQFTLKANTTFDGIWTQKGRECTEKETLLWNGTRVG
ncbi:MAG: hypothetical protein EAZ91_21625 [Cytophagales bacterium]|nr:MAG: hypothetical protein EAZ91_21625 [Cytophagales bacterium]